ncbi:ATP-binding protein [Neobacillus sp. MM2021_6]|uniref:ATP-binding protein n=1 Tax=Bacillaceae TaxID=186817 RepID=UPI00140BAC5C|nr:MULTISPECIES: ATP-binding protein [Bacillaceae]MBO0961973.1 ATP-binding protein [Neobacillus sp. MM2021_6]NHC20330.1 ATP-binding protein [Bacillus sp. MM2020_4]
MQDFEVLDGKIEKAKKVVLYGPEGIGKSSLAAQFPDPIFIDTEGSTTELNVKRVKKPTSWTMLNQQVDWVKSKVGTYKTLIIDTVDWAEMQCTEFVCSQHNKSGVEDFGYGNGYVYVKEELGRFLNKLSDVVEAGIHVVLTAHAQIVKFEQPDEMGSYDRYQLKLGKKTSSQTAPLVKEWADMVLFINYKTYSVAVDDKGKKHKAQGGVRTVHATHHPAWDAKNRHGLPDEFPLDYSYIAHIFNGVQQAPTQTAVQSSAPPVQQQMQPPVQPTQPPVDPVPAPANPTPVNTVKLNPLIPQSLRDLMQQNGVSEEEIQVVVSQKGYYPMDTPIINYDSSFIEGVLVGAWAQVHGMVVDFRKTLPF